MRSRGGMWKASGLWLVLASVGCDANTADRGTRDAPVVEQETLSADRVAARVKSDFECERPRLPDKRDGKTLYGLSNKVFYRIVAEECSEAERRALLDYTVRANATGHDPYKLAYGTPGVLIHVYIDRGDRAAVVNVLARACPERVYMRAVEEFVTYHGPPGIPHPITMFFDAYGVSREAHASANIASALRRGFSFTGALPENDDDLVRHCREWYEANQDRVEFNREYYLNAATETRPPEPLFRFKAVGE